MWKRLLVAALILPVSPLDARESPRKGDRVEKREASELRRDVERISKEIYRARRERRR